MVRKLERLESRNDRKAKTTRQLERPEKPEQPKSSLLQHIGVPMPFASTGDPDRKIFYRLYFADFFLALCANIIGAGRFGAPIVLAHCKASKHVR